MTRATCDHCVTRVVTGGSFGEGIFKILNYFRLVNWFGSGLNYSWISTNIERQIWPWFMGWATGNKNDTSMFIQCLMNLFSWWKRRLSFSLTLFYIAIMGFVPLRKVGAGQQMLVIFTQMLQYWSWDLSHVCPGSVAGDHIWFPKPKKSLLCVTVCCVPCVVRRRRYGGGAATDSSEDASPPLIPTYSRTLPASPVLQTIHRFYNHGEGPYKAHTNAFTLKTLLTIKTLS